MQTIGISIRQNADFAVAQAREIATVWFNTNSLNNILNFLRL